MIGNYRSIGEMKIFFVLVLSILVNVVIWWMTMDPEHKKALSAK